MSPSYHPAGWQVAKGGRMHDLHLAGGGERLHAEVAALFLALALVVEVHAQRQTSVALRVIKTPLAFSSLSAALVASGLVSCRILDGVPGVARESDLGFEARNWSSNRRFIGHQDGLAFGFDAEPGGSPIAAFEGSANSVA